MFKILDKSHFLMGYRMKNLNQGKEQLCEFPCSCNTSHNLVISAFISAGQNGSLKILFGTRL